jgi:hypothetical protein
MENVFLIEEKNMGIYSNFFIIPTLEKSTIQFILPTISDSLVLYLDSCKIIAELQNSDGWSLDRNLFLWLKKGRFRGERHATE